MSVLRPGSCKKAVQGDKAGWLCVFWVGVATPKGSRQDAHDGMRPAAHDLGNRDGAVAAWANSCD